MNVQTVFKRYEMKYFLTPAQKAAVLEAIRPHMALDQYGHTTIRNIYYDTDNYRLVRRSLEKPAYKEKLRVRSYSLASPDSTVFVELKKKYDSVVYKRRVALPEREAMAWVSGEGTCSQDTQIAGEIQYFLDYYGPLRPACFLSYERDAFYSLDGSDFRVTFDGNILCRQSDMTLTREAWGESLTAEGQTLMEIKTSGGLPMWMVKTLSGEGICQASFSKYGTAYKELIFPASRGIFTAPQYVPQDNIIYHKGVRLYA